MKWLLKHWKLLVKIKTKVTGRERIQQGIKVKISAGSFLQRAFPFPKLNRNQRKDATVTVRQEAERVLLGLVRTAYLGTYVQLRTPYVPPSTEMTCYMSCLLNDIFYTTQHIKLLLIGIVSVLCGRVTADLIFLNRNSLLTYEASSIWLLFSEKIFSFPLLTFCVYFSLQKGEGVKE